VLPQVGANVVGRIWASFKKESYPSVSLHVNPSIFSSVIGCTQKFSRFRGSRQSFEADHGILQNAQVRGDPLELNVDDALFPQSQYG
jgi:hypothetical protein